MNNLEAKRKATNLAAGILSRSVSGTQSVQRTATPKAQSISPVSVSPRPDAGANLAGLAKALGYAGDAFEMARKQREEDLKEQYAIEAKKFQSRFLDARTTANGDESVYRSITAGIRKEVLSEDDDPIKHQMFERQFVTWEEQDIRLLQSAKEELAEAEGRAGKKPKATSPASVMFHNQMGQADHLAASFRTNKFKSPVGTEEYSEEEDELYRSYMDKLSDPRARARFMEATQEQRVYTEKMRQKAAQKENLLDVTRGNSSSLLVDIHGTFEAIDTGLNLEASLQSLDGYHEAEDFATRNGLLIKDHMRGVVKRDMLRLEEQADTYGIHIRDLREAYVRDLVDTAVQYGRPEILKGVFDGMKSSDGIVDFETQYGRIISKGIREAQTQQEAVLNRLRRTDAWEKQQARDEANIAIGQGIIAIREARKSGDLAAVREAENNLDVLQKEYGETLGVDFLASVKRNGDAVLAPEDDPMKAREVYSFLLNGDVEGALDYTLENIEQISEPTLNRVLSARDGTSSDSLRAANNLMGLLEDDLKTAFIDPMSGLMNPVGKQAMADFSRELVALTSELYSEDSSLTTDDVAKRVETIRSKLLPQGSSIGEKPTDPSVGLAALFTASGGASSESQNEGYSRLVMLDDAQREEVMEKADLPEYIRHTARSLAAISAADRAAQGIAPDLGDYYMGVFDRNTPAASYGYVSGLGQASIRSGTGAGTITFLRNGEQSMNSFKQADGTFDNRLATLAKSAHVTGKAPFLELYSKLTGASRFNSTSGYNYYMGATIHEALAKPDDDIAGLYDGLSALFVARSLGTGNVSQLLADDPKKVQEVISKHEDAVALLNEPAIFIGLLNVAREQYQLPKVRLPDAEASSAAGHQDVTAALKSISALFNELSEVEGGGVLSKMLQAAKKQENSGSHFLLAGESSKKLGHIKHDELENFKAKQFKPGDTQEGMSGEFSPGTNFKRYIAGWSSREPRYENNTKVKTVLTPADFNHKVSEAVSRYGSGLIDAETAVRKAYAFRESLDDDMKANFDGALSEDESSWFEAFIWYATND